MGNGLEEGRVGNGGEWSGGKGVDNSNGLMRSFIWCPENFVSEQDRLAETGDRLNNEDQQIQVHVFGQYTLSHHKASGHFANKKN